MMYYVFENRNVGFNGNPEFVETVMFSTEDKKEAARFETELRKTYNDRKTVDCYVRSEEEMDREAKAKARYDALTDEQKHDYIIVNGRKYIKALYEA